LTETTFPTSSRARGGGLAVAVALAAANLLGYGFNLVASRRLGPAGYGAVAALLGLVLIGNVIALALQAVVARRAVRARRDAGAGNAMVTGWANHLAWRAGLGLLGLGLVASPLVAAWLHLRSPVGAVAVAVTLLPLTLIGAQLGVLQGAESFHRLAALYAMAGLGKVGGGVVGVLAVGSVSGAMVGTALGACLAAVVGHRLVTRGASAPAGERDAHAAGAAREVVHAAYALGALFALSNVDVVLARHYLSAHDAGLYAVGAVVAKGCFWLPSFVPVMALPGLADPLRRRATASRAFAVVAVSAAALTVGAYAFGSLVVRMIGGSAYTELGDRVWLFAAAGSLLAVAQVLLYSRLATEDRRAIAPMWAVVVLEAAVIALWRHASPSQIVTVVVCASLALAVAGAFVEAKEHGLWLRLTPRSRRAMGRG
jgi:hypothetical protein